ncbi:hypothetical protein D9613_001141 [Agrocybe pediades]|uniref:CHAT domain-containing protein n=1 Tax=Agrocybe pediades TaxID=84607 RepID=A0A8H4R146_9AGAR|nr:hypothetical protein D9613_001141 [Agrocybe pediades]
MVVIQGPASSRNKGSAPSPLTPTPKHEGSDKLFGGTLRVMSRRPSLYRRSSSSQSISLHIPVKQRTTEHAEIDVVDKSSTGVSVSVSTSSTISMNSISVRTNNTFSTTSVSSSITSITGSSVSIGFSSNVAADQTQPETCTIANLPCLSSSKPPEPDISTGTSISTALVDHGSLEESTHGACSVTGSIPSLHLPASTLPVEISHEDTYLREIIADLDEANRTVQTKVTEAIMMLNRPTSFQRTKSSRDLYLRMFFLCSPHFNTFITRLENLFIRIADADDFSLIITHSMKRLLLLHRNPRLPDVLIYLSKTFLVAYRTSQRIARLEAALHASMVAAAITKHNRSSECHQRVLEILVEVHHTRHHRFYTIGSKLEELKLAIGYAREAAELSSKLDNVRGYFCLSNVLRSQYILEGKKDVGRLDESLEWIKKAIEKLPEDDPERPFSSFLHGRLLLSRYLHHHPVVKKESLLCALLQPNLEALEVIKELDAAIRLIKSAQEGLEQISPKHPKLAMVYCCAGEALEARYWAVLLCADLAEAHTYYEKAVDHSESPLEAIVNARAAAKLHLKEIDDANQQIRTQDYAWAQARLSYAVKLLLKNILQSIPIDDQQFALSQVCGLPAEAVAVTLSAAQNNNLEGVLEILEKSRGVIIGSSIALRSLERKRPEEFKKLQTAFKEVAAPRSEDLSQGAPPIKSVEARYIELEKVLATIRQLDGFDDFLSPPKKDDMEKLVEHGGAIVVFNAAETRSDAIVMISKKLKHIPLPGFKLSDIEVKIAQMQRTLHDWDMSNRSDRNIELRSILEWLWISAVKPVCSYLKTVNKCHRRNTPAATHDQGSRLVERIWWIGVGLLSKLPFHAAGIHGVPRKKKETLIHNFRSSYIPTIKALSHAVKAWSASKDNGDMEVNLSMIHMEKTPGYAPLRGIHDEVRDIADIAAIDYDVHVQVLNTPSRMQVLEHLNDLKQGTKATRQHIIHFSCHGVCDFRNPLDSHVVLADTDGETFSPVRSELSKKDKETTELPTNNNSEFARGQPAHLVQRKPTTPPATNLLSVRDICDLDLNNAYLAYLGACHTANNAVRELADESLHLASAFQMAGCRNVVGNMWLAANTECIQLSQEFYKRLLETSSSSWSDLDGNVSEAYHHAVLSVWENGDNGADPIGWASFVHYGV